jgi:hypothetical protein
MDAIEKRLHELRVLAGEYAKAKSEQDYLENFRHSKLAILMKQAEREGYQTSAAQDREARANPEYLALLDGLKVATEKAERCRWELKIAELGAGLWQTTQATKRAEMKGYS